MTIDPKAQIIVLEKAVKGFKEIVTMNDDVLSASHLSYGVGLIEGLIEGLKMSSLKEEEEPTTNPR